MARKYGKKAQRKVKRAMHERKRGTLRSGRSGKKVTSRKQAIAIGLSEARRAGAKVPRKRRAAVRRARSDARVPTRNGSPRAAQAACSRQAVVARQRAIQRQVARADRAHPRKEAKRAMQAGARRYPEPPLPRQHERKPGAETRLDPAPMYEAPFYLAPPSSPARLH